MKISIAFKTQLLMMIFGLFMSISMYSRSGVWATAADWEFPEEEHHDHHDDYDYPCYAPEYCHHPPVCTCTCTCTSYKHPPCKKTPSPTNEPTLIPTVQPSEEPTSQPTNSTSEPTLVPTEGVLSVPTVTPTTPGLSFPTRPPLSPTEEPTRKTKKPTASPSFRPTRHYPWYNHPTYQDDDWRDGDDDNESKP